MDVRNGILPLTLSALLAHWSAASAAPVTGLAPHSDFHDPAAHGMVVTADAQLRGSVRQVRGVRWQRRAGGHGPGDTWSTFVRATGGQWNSAWDQATGAPLRIWGEGLAAPGAMASPQIAEAIARQLLASHLALLAPGAAVEDFRLVSNHSDGDQRSVGFVQTYQGLRVVGGQVSFRFKNDRLFVIASEAVPNLTVSVPQRRARLSATRLRQEATARLASLGLPADAQVMTALVEPEPVVLPLVGEHSILGARVVVPQQVTSPQFGSWTVYSDPSTGAAMALQSHSLYANGRVLYNVPVRYPGKPRASLPATRMKVTIGGTEVVTSGTGAVTWSPDSPQTLITSLTGELVTIVNKSGMAVASATLTISPGQDAVWDASGTATDDAQVTAAVHAGLAKEYVRSFAPTLPILDQVLVTNVNVNAVCNASYDTQNKNLNFYRSSSQCENTGRLADVIYHEFGHAMHHASIIEGVGAMDGALSEGLSDFLAVSITEDPGMGRGFFYNDTALRHLDPEGKEPRWPEDVGEIHKTGIIIGASLWDLRKALIVSMGRTAAIPHVNRIFHAVAKRASDIPTALVEVLAADDDDGNLANGTPNECTILSEFGKHGLRSVTGISTSPGSVVAGAGGTAPVTVTLLGRSPRCASDAVSSVEITWRPGISGPEGGRIQATATGTPEVWAAEVPVTRSGIATFTATVTLASSAKFVLPDNYADAAYQLYEGQTIPLLCANMDQNPLTADWTGSAGWEWGAPSGASKLDPAAAFSGNGVLGTILNGNYSAEKSYTLTLPTVDVQSYSDVRLQYRRWLSVEDSFYDKAQITANDNVAWTNATDGRGEDSALHNVDREWRFHDVPLTSKFRGNQLTVGFSLTSDQGLEFGGWAIDDLCIVANPASICGDGQVSGQEECDAGAANSDKPNNCRLDCKRATCGDSIVDKGEECDDGAETTSCTATCFSTDTGGCCDAGSGPGGPALLSLLTLGLIGLSRRRRAA